MKIFILYYKLSSYKKAYVKKWNIIFTIDVLISILKLLILTYFYNKHNVVVESSDNL